MTARSAWACWNLKRADASGVTVDEGSKADMETSARLRNGTAERHGLAETVAFVALPYGRQPTMADLPPLPEPPEREPLPRTRKVLANEAAATAASPRPAGERARQARELVNEAFELGKAASAAEHRKALGKAWSAALDGIPDEFWKYLPYDDPELYWRFRKFLLGG